MRAGARDRIPVDAGRWGRRRGWRRPAPLLPRPAVVGLPGRVGGLQDDVVVLAVVADDERDLVGGARDRDCRRIEALQAGEIDARDGVGRHVPAVGHRPVAGVDQAAGGVEERLRLDRRVGVGPFGDLARAAAAVVAEPEDLDLVVAAGAAVDVDLEVDRVAGVDADVGGEAFDLVAVFDVPIGRRRTTRDDGVLVDNLVHLEWPPANTCGRGGLRHPTKSQAAKSRCLTPAPTRLHSARDRLECQTNFRSFVRNGERDVVPPGKPAAIRAPPARSSGRAIRYAIRGVVQVGPYAPGHPNEASLQRRADSLLIKPRPDEHELLPAVAERRAPVAPDPGERLRRRSASGCVASPPTSGRAAGCPSTPRRG